jgi:seryl-tRNA synthetase
VVKELSKLKEENRNLERNLSELERERGEAHKTFEDLTKEGELREMMKKLNLLEEELSNFRSEKRQLEWLLSSLGIAEHLR